MHSSMIGEEPFWSVKIRQQHCVAVPNDEFDPSKGLGTYTALTLYICLIFSVGATFLDIGDILWLTR